jgi:hypothetical protein
MIVSIDVVNCSVVAPAQDAQREDCQMQVNVFVTRKEGQPQRELLVLPNSPEAAIPPEY